MADYNQLLEKIDQIDAAASGGLCSFHEANWYNALKRIQAIIQSKDEPSFSAPLESVDARYNDLIKALGVNGHDGAMAEIANLRKSAGLDRSTNEDDEKTLQVRLRQRAAPDAASGSVYALLIEAANRIADHEESDNDQRRLVRELDAIINGPGAAKQASLCDIVKQMHKEAFHTQSTDMARRLLQIANDPMWANHAEVDKTTLKAAAHEIDRFYHGMLAWKRTASEKDFSNRTPFQQRVYPWMMACFGKEISGDKVERNHRFFEEATELVQACGMTKDEALLLIDYTYNREIGEREQEVGGVMVTLAALCLAQEDLDMQQAAETELIRIWGAIPKIRAKQATKPKSSPLPE